MLRILDRSIAVVYGYFPVAPIVAIPTFNAVSDDGFSVFAADYSPSVLATISPFTMQLFSVRNSISLRLVALKLWGATSLLARKLGPSAVSPTAPLVDVRAGMVPDDLRKSLRLIFPL